MADWTPQSRVEEILFSTINGEPYDGLPQSRIEELLLELKAAIEAGGGGGGTSNYNDLSNKPQIGGVTLQGDKSLSDLGIKNEFIGTLAEWNALTTEQKKAYDTYQIKGDYTEGGGGSDDYTDTEQKVGTWFGDDLYRKSYYFENVSKGAHSLGIQNLDKIIKVEGGYIERFVDPSVSYGFVPFPYSNGAFTSDNFTGVECNITNGTVIFNWGSNHDPLQKDAVMTVYYTKTA